MTEADKATYRQLGWNLNNQPAVVSGDVTSYNALLLILLQVITLAP